MLDPTKPNRDLLLLSPWFKIKVDMGLNMIRALGVKADVFEGFRSPQRSDYLYEQGRTTPGKIVTKAKAWQSFHSYGLACDIVGKDDKGNWTWNIEYKRIIEVMRTIGFTCGEIWGDKPHFQMDGGFTWQEAKAITEQQSLPVLWSMIAERTEQRQKAKQITVT